MQLEIWWQLKNNALPKDSSGATCWCADWRLLARFNWLHVVRSPSLISSLHATCGPSPTRAPPLHPFYIAGPLSPAWAAGTRYAFMSGRSTRLPPCRAVRPRTRRRKAKRGRARRKPPAAPAQRRRASLRATRSQVRGAEREGRSCCVLFWHCLCETVWTIFDLRNVLPLQRKQKTEKS